MKYISIDNLKAWYKELRFQSEDQTAAVYDRMPALEIVRCEHCKHSNTDNTYGMLWCRLGRAKPVEPDFFCRDGGAK